MLGFECYACLFLFKVFRDVAFFCENKEFCCVVLVCFYAFPYDVQPIDFRAQLGSYRCFLFFLSLLNKLCSACCIIFRHGLNLVLPQEFLALLKRMRMRVSNFYVCKLIALMGEEIVAYLEENFSNYRYIFFEKKVVISCYASRYRILKWQTSQINPAFLYSLEYFLKSAITYRFYTFSIVLVYSCLAVSAFNSLIAYLHFSSLLSILLKDFMKPFLISFENLLYLFISLKSCSVSFFTISSMFISLL